MELARLLESLQSSRLSTAIGGSTPLLGLLSAIHLLGLTLLVGGALVSSLRLFGVVLADRPVGDVTSAPFRGMAIGLSISMASGLLLFAPRAPAAFENGIFRIKMLLLLAAALLHVAIQRRVARRPEAPRYLVRLAGASGLLWFGVAAAGCAYILLE
jgi:hypothetical protein